MFLLLCAIYRIAFCVDKAIFLDIIQLKLMLINTGGSFTGHSVHFRQKSYYYTMVKSVSTLLGQGHAAMDINILGLLSKSWDAVYCKLQQAQLRASSTLSNGASKRWLFHTPLTCGFIIPRGRQASSFERKYGTGSWFLYLHFQVDVPLPFVRPCREFLVCLWSACLQQDDGGADEGTFSADVMRVGDWGLGIELM